MHLNGHKTNFKICKGHFDYGLVYSRVSGNNMLKGYSDSDLDGHINDMWSTGGMAFNLNRSLITWVSQKQNSVAISSCEAEFMVVAAIACQGIWLRKLPSQITST